MCSKNLTDRLRDELARVKFGMEEIAKHLSVSRGTVYNWLKNGNIPAYQLCKLVELGINTQYVMFGGDGSSEASAPRGATHNVQEFTRIQIPVTPEEDEWLGIFRSIPPDLRKHMAEIARALAQGYKTKKIL